jgi:hypothetical protein
MKYRWAIKMLFIITVMSFTYAVFAREKKVAKTSPELFREIAMQDSLLFAAFNMQNLGVFKSYFSTDLEWYQDNGGLISYDTVFMNFDNNFRKANKLTRKLVKGSMEVHPIKGYGAIETGSHRFTHLEDGKEIVGTFKFFMIWKKERERWQVTRVVSYDH